MRKSLTEFAVPQRRSAANKILSVFHGGVYVVKNTLRVAQCRSPAACGGVRRGAE